MPQDPPRGLAVFRVYTFQPPSIQTKVELLTEAVWWDFVLLLGSLVYFNRATAFRTKLNWSCTTAAK
uniref:Uncharacterized protein n=1 Tax=Anguilla anguilla TaxID=7936 RepID=A0A0E9QU76_ANGAN